MTLSEKEYQHNWYLKNKSKKNEQSRQWRENNPHRSKEISRNSYERTNKCEVALKNQRETQLLCKEMRGNRCEVCGSKYRRLSFHHKHPRDKKFNISGRHYFTDSLIKELEKCLLVCASCHRLLHGELEDEETSNISDKQE